MALGGQVQNGRAVVTLDAGDTLVLASLTQLAPMELISGANITQIVAKVNELITRQNAILDALRPRS